MESIKFAIFDIAGTTATDDGLVVKAFVDAAHEVLLFESESELSTMVSYVNETMGMRKMDVFMHLTKGDEKLAALTHEHFVNAYNRLVSAGELQEFPGISELFHQLRAAGIGVGLTTGFPRELLNSILSRLNWRDAIDVSVASDEVTHGRPHPDMIFRAMDVYANLSNQEIAPENIVVIGDTESDMQAGVSAGARKVIGVTSGAHKKDQLIAAGASDVIAFSTEIFSVINL